MMYSFVAECAKNMVIGLLLLGIIFYDLKKQTGRLEGSQRVFSYSLLFNALLLVFEFFMNLLSGNGTNPGRLLLPAVTALYLALIPFPMALWLVYIETMVAKGVLPPRRFSTGVFIPAAVNAVLCGAGLLWEGVFVVDAANVYHRGPLFGLIMAVCYGYLASFLALTVSHRKNIVRSEYVSLLLAGLLPMTGVLVQILFPLISLAWVSLSFSMLIIYFNMQSVQIYTDHLTGLANRRRFDSKTRSAFSGLQNGMKVAGIMLDVDHFKMVNDRYGHDVGDVALEAVGDILRRSVRRGDLAARIGGDEFAVVMEAESGEDVERVIARIRQNTALENLKGRFPFRLRLSVGYELFPKTGSEPPQDFLARIDQKMYADKRAHQSGGR